MLREITYQLNDAFKNGYKATPKYFNRARLDFWNATRWEAKFDSEIQRIKIYDTQHGTLIAQILDNPGGNLTIKNYSLSIVEDYIFAVLEKYFSK